LAKVKERDNVLIQPIMGSTGSKSYLEIDEKSREIAFKYFQAKKLSPIHVVPEGQSHSVARLLDGPETPNHLQIRVPPSQVETVMEYSSIEVTQTDDFDPIAFLKK
jgi:hypothetical protein